MNPQDTLDSYKKIWDDIGSWWDEKILDGDELLFPNFKRIHSYLAVLRDGLTFFDHH